MLSASITLDDADRRVETSLLPECERGLPRTSVSIYRDGDSITLTIEASDATAMRAALNSYLGWIRITEDIGCMVRQ